MDVRLPAERVGRCVVGNNKEFHHRNKSFMTSDLFRVGDVVSPTFGLLKGVKGVVSDVGRTVAIDFPRKVRKHMDSAPRSTWCYIPDNVRLEAFPKRKLRVRE